MMATQSLTRLDLTQGTEIAELGHHLGRKWQKQAHRVHMPIWLRLEENTLSSPTILYRKHIECLYMSVAVLCTDLQVVPLLNGFYYKYYMAQTCAETLIMNLDLRTLPLVIAFGTGAKHRKRTKRLKV